jgi:hypothetical protein
MKWISRFFTFSLLGAAIIIPFFIQNENGSPSIGMPTVDDFIPDKFLPDSITGKESTHKTASKSANQTFYKWQDELGTWHYGDTPPPGSSNVASLQVNTNANIIQSLKIEDEEEEVTQMVSQQPKMSESMSDGKLTVDDAMNIMSDAKNVRDMMESRNEQLKMITGESN